ncbi:MAG: cytochrome P450 [Pseudomonadales bacterium]|nr:cytochrome P450 [Pseudomonadales bacterium]
MLEVPQPKGLPLIGNLISLFAGRENCIYDAFDKQAELNGDIFNLKIVNKNWYIVSDLGLIKEVLVKNVHEFPKGTTIDELKQIGIGESGIVETEGEQWLRQRRLCNQAFRKKELHTMYGSMVEKCLEGADLLSREPDLNILHFMNRLGLSIICKVSFSHNVDCLKSMTAEDKVLTTQNVGASELRKRVQFGPFWKYLPTPGNFLVRKLVKEQIAFFNSLIDERLESEEHKNDLLDRLLAAKDENGDSLSRKEIVDQMQNFLGAGHETTATAMHWFLYLLSQHKDVEAKVVEEVRSVYAGRDAIDVDELDKLEYTKAAIMETLRYKPPFPTIPREVGDAKTLGDYRVERGAWVFIMIQRVHYDPKYWGEDADKFNPDRFYKNDNPASDRYAFMPFGIGARSCIGDKMAIMEMLTIASLLLNKFQFELDPNQKVVPYLLFTQISKFGMSMKVIARD